MTQLRLSGVLTKRRRGWRGTARRLGAAFGVLALLLQCLAFAVHQPAQAASITPFNDPAAWCGLPDMGGPSLPDDGKAPSRGSIVCPICQTLQAAGAGLVPPAIVLVAPAAVLLLGPPVVDSTPPPAHGRFSASPRGPPILL